MLDSLPDDVIDLIHNPFIAECTVGAGGGERRIFCAADPHATDLCAQGDASKRALTSEMLSRVPMHPSVRQLYELRSSPSEEFYFRSMTFLSLDSILQIYEDAVHHGQHRVVDIGFVYQGMGHVCVWSYDPQTRMFFRRDDGGSNGHERIQHHNEKMTLSPDDCQLYSLNDFICAIS